MATLEYKAASNKKREELKAEGDPASVIISVMFGYGKWSYARIDEVRPDGEHAGKPCATVKFTHTDKDGNVRPIPPLPTDPEKLESCRSFGTCQVPNDETRRACLGNDGMWRMLDEYQKKK